MATQVIDRNVLDSTAPLKAGIRAQLVDHISTVIEVLAMYFRGPLYIPDFVEEGGPLTLKERSEVRANLMGIH